MIISIKLHNSIMIHFYHGDIFVIYPNEFEFSTKLITEKNINRHKEILVKKNRNILSYIEKKWPCLFDDQ